MKPRGLLIANPNATSTSPGMLDVITRALSHELDLEVVATTHRGHAAELAAESSGLDLLITLGGDGTINEVVNGLLGSGHDPLPMLATIPGGSANVMARALGFPNEAIEATGMILESLRTQAWHAIGIGNARFTPLEPLEPVEPVDDPVVGAAAAPRDPGEQSVWFTINAGLGLDARVVSAMEHQRATGHAATPARYVATATREYFRDHERTHPQMRLELPDEEPIDGIGLVIVQNTAPWTYLGPFPVNPCPQASFETGLDLFAIHSLGVQGTVRYGLRMLRGSTAPSVEGELTARHDLTTITVRTATPIHLQLDGDSWGLVETVHFRAARDALRIVG